MIDNLILDCNYCGELTKIVGPEGRWIEGNWYQNNLCEDCCENAW